MEILTSVRRLYISFKSLVNDFVYSFGRAALLLLVEVQNHTVPVWEHHRIRVKRRESQYTKLFLKLHQYFKTYYLIIHFFHQIIIISQPKTNFINKVWWETLFTFPHIHQVYCVKLPPEYLAFSIISPGHFQKISR